MISEIFKSSILFHPVRMDRFMANYIEADRNRPWDSDPFDFDKFVLSKFTEEELEILSEKVQGALRRFKHV